MIRYDIYQPWTSMLNALNEAGTFAPTIVRNASPESSIAPNHLVAINYLASRALDHINNVITKLNNSGIE